MYNLLLLLMTFQVQGRTFAFREDNIFPLRVLGIPTGFSLYDSKNKHYLCPDEHTNVSVKKDGKYCIRKVFFLEKNKVYFYISKINLLYQILYIF